MFRSKLLLLKILLLRVSNLMLMALRFFKSAVCCVSIMCALCMSARTVVSESTGKPIAYASVGVVNRNLGTVTDTLGFFSLKIPDEYLADTLRISSIGYVAKSFAVSVLASVPDTIALADGAINLGEVVVKPQKIKHKTAGRKGSGGFVYIDVKGYDAAGKGIAIPVKVKKQAWLKEIGFIVVDNSETLSAMKFRVNVYRKVGDSYLPETIKPVYFDYRKSDLVDGKFSFTFADEIMLDKGDYYIELEFLENFTEEYFFMRTKPMTGKTRYRYASQSEWETIPFGVPIYIDYDTVE